jgi:hypothetical protein
MRPIRGKLFVGQHFIYSLRVIEHYLRTVSRTPKKIEKLVKDSVEAELTIREELALAAQAQAQAQTAQGAAHQALHQALQGGRAAGLLADLGDLPANPADPAYRPWSTHDQQMLDLLRAPLKGHDGVADGVVPPHASVLFSSVVLSHPMRENPATLNNYMQVFAKKYAYYYQSALVKYRTPQRAERSVAESMSGTPYRVRDLCITTNLASLVRSVMMDSAFFDGLNLFYYLFYRWHRIDYSHIRAVEEAGVQLPYRDALVSVLRLLEERRLSFDVQEVVALMDEYFEYYARFISDPQVVEALDYSYYTCWKYNSPDETERMLRDLWTVHRAFYRMEKAAPPTADDPSAGRGVQARRCLSPRRAREPQSERNRKPRDAVWMCEGPRIPDRMPYATGATWESSFTNAFAAVVERKRRTAVALTGLKELVRRNTIFTKSNYKNLELLLETANMTPRDTTLFASNIYCYDTVRAAAEEGRFPHFAALSFSPPYYPFIDSLPDALLGCNNFTFEAEPAHRIPSLEAGPFKPLIDDFINDSRLKAINAGYEGISEFKIYLHGCERDDGTPSGGGSPRSSPHYTFRAGKCDYFTGVARKDLFSRFLVPSVGNLRQPLLYLLEHGTLPEFVLQSAARTAQRRYQEMADEGDPPNVRLSRLFASDPALEAELTRLLRDKIDELYARVVAASHTLGERGAIHILDNGATYTGCGTFVLTGDRDAEGCDRPYLLLEKRWRVSEENDNLSYPSGGSCDLYVPDDRVPQTAEWEALKELEGSPFITAARELREELNLICRPDDLQLVSFGIDVNRNLQQFSFVLETDHSAQHILDRKHFAATPREGFTFFLPFERRVICDILNNYQMESGAVYSLMRLLELKSHRLWPSEG